MGWLHEHGLMSKYEDYLRLPIGILEDARLLMQQEALDRQRRMREVNRAR